MSFEPFESAIAAAAAPGPSVGVDELLDLTLRVCAEIGRARLPAAEVVALPHGAIVDLDSAADEPADIYVNGHHFGTGRVIELDGEWAIRIETLDNPKTGLEQTSSPASDA